jgi:hypothetical protein
VRCSLRHPHPAEGIGDTGDLSDRWPKQVHLKHHFFHISTHALVALEEPGDELTFPISGHLCTLDPVRRRGEVALVVTIALSSPCVGEFPVAGSKVPGLFFENLLQHSPHALADSSLHVQLYVVLEHVFWGQVSPFSLNLQLTRHHRSQSCQ